MRSIEVNAQRQNSTCTADATRQEWEGYKKQRPTLQTEGDDTPWHFVFLRHGRVVNGCSCLPGTGRRSHPGLVLYKSSKTMVNHCSGSPRGLAPAPGRDSVLETGGSTRAAWGFGCFVSKNGHEQLPKSSTFWQSCSNANGHSTR